MTTLFRPIVAISAAFALFLIAGILFWSGLHSQRAKPHVARQQSTAPVTGTIIIANTDIPAGQVLAPADIELRNVSPANMPVAALHQTDYVQGHMALADIRAGSPILRSSISKSTVHGIATQVPVGYRAYAISVNESSIVGGFLQVGDHTDLYVTLPGALFGEQAAGGRKLDDQSKSTLLLPNVNVLAVGTKLKTDGTADTSARTVTVVLKSESLAKVVLAARLGTITFAIRNPIDENAASSQSATLSALMNVPRTTVPELPRQAAPATTNGIIVYAGRDRSVVHVP